MYDGTFFLTQQKHRLGVYKIIPQIFKKSPLLVFVGYDRLIYFPINTQVWIVIEQCSLRVFAIILSTLIAKNSDLR